MKILVLDFLINQTKDARTIPPDVLPRVYEEYRTLSELEKSAINSLQAYLKNKNGKMMQGAEHVYKYRLTDGDRILYTYGKYIPCISDREKESLVLIGYAKHDEQGHMGAEFDLTRNHSYAYVADIVSALDDLEIANLHSEGFETSDLYAIAEIISSPDYMRNHAIYVTSEKTMATLSPEMMEKVLSPEQDQCISGYFREPKPTLIQGGAGTGKTLIAVHMLNDFNRGREDIGGVYFTQSRELRIKVEKMYDVIKEEKENNTIEFLDINEFCLDRLGLNRSNFIQTKQFLDFLQNRDDLLSICKANHLEPLDIWAEIRGTLKGAMSAEWTRTGLLSQIAFPRGINSLVYKGYFLRDAADKQRFSLSDSIEKIRDKAKDDISLTPIERDYLNQAMEYYCRFDSSIRTLTKEQYLSLSEENTTLDAALRVVVWKICQAYELYLEENMLYDENDLVRRMFSLPSDKMPKYDFVVVDEIQDYTELQIFLLRTMCKLQERVIFAGDGNQIIHPTLFRESRLQALFRTNTEGTNLNIVHLVQNYRCQKNVVDTSNALSELRRKRIGSKAIELEQPEVAMRNGEMPIRLKYNRENIKRILEEVIEYPRAAILVADEQSKQDIIGIIGENKYEEAGVPCVFTVSEIKGMEYAYVVCFDLIGHYASVWRQILNGKDISHKTKYRFYFNLLYVAITRAQEYLCFLDETTVDELEKSFCFQMEDRFDSNALHFSNLSNLFSDWVEQAQEFEQAGKYEEAIASYRKANAPEAEIYRCEIHLAFQNRDFDRAALYCIITEDLDDLKRSLSEPLSGDILELANLYVSLVENQAIPKGYHSRHIPLIERVFHDFSSAECIKAKETLQKAFLNTLHTLVNFISEIAGEI